MKKLFFLFVLIFTNLVNSQELLNLGYSYGTLPTNINTDDVLTAYNSWKNTFTETCGDDRSRVRFDITSETVSEGIGYGMLISVYIGDQELFDGLWNYYSDFLNQNGVMNWKINGCSNAIGLNGATDAELDVAMALIIASHRWENTNNINYKTAASNLINTIKTHEIESGTNILKPGDVWGGFETTNISYYAPSYYRAYKTHTNDNSWDNIANKSYEIITLNQAATGAVYNLVSDWCKGDGKFSAEVASWAKHQGKKYDYDAGRTPWRIAMDYLWYGTTNALAYTNKCIDFIKAKNGLDNIYPGYNLDGTPSIQSYKDVTFTGAYATAAMSSTDQTFVNNAYTQVVNMPIESYFGATLRVLYLLTLSGNLYSPEQFATLSTENYINNNSTHFFPNPVENEMIISFKNSNKNKVQIYTLQGQLILSNNYTTNKTTINLESLSTNTYVIKINNKGYLFSKQ